MVTNPRSDPSSAGFIGSTSDATTLQGRSKNHNRDDRKTPVNQIAATLVAVKTKRGLAHLSQEVLSLERGDVPDIGGVLKALEEVADQPVGRHAEAVIDLCERLTCYLQELQSDGFELCLDDLDVLLDGCEQLEAMIANVSPKIDLMQRADRPSQASIPASFRSPGASPKIHLSGLLSKIHGSKLRLVVPPLDTPEAQATVLQELINYWHSEDQPKEWEIDFSRIERVPTSLISELVKLSKSSTDSSRCITIVGGFAELQSQTLIGSLGKVFRLG